MSSIISIHLSLGTSCWHCYIRESNWPAFLILLTSLSSSLLRRSSSLVIFSPRVLVACYSKAAYLSSESLMSFWPCIILSALFLSSRFVHDSSLALSYSTCWRSRSCSCFFVSKIYLVLRFFCSARDAITELLNKVFYMLLRMVSSSCFLSFWVLYIKKSSSIFLFLVSTLGATIFLYMSMLRSCVTLRFSRSFNRFAVSSDGAFSRAIASYFSEALIELWKAIASVL